ncbi:hypothetical protein B296_00008181 [Ensete ventricosum]|uniref:Uncharacterized protein n=1 Tax=Ensete ventricosum TaxID=4639 RepID=A0A427BB96_ENSVE|nr:hypothetical protein B296_00008181 [Ensete ventricosum]
MVSQRQDFRGVIDPLVSWRESVGRKRGPDKVENTEANSKYQDRAEGKRPRNFIRPVKDPQKSAQLSQHIQESIIGKLKQPGKSEFDYSTTTTESS